jgi:hypothetical protein
MKKLLLFGIPLLALHLSAQTILVETPVFDGVVVVTGADPAPIATAVTPAVYDHPVVYTAPVQYNAPVVYNAPVTYNCTPTTACGNDFGGMSITVYPRRNGYNRCNSNVIIIGRGRR